MFIEKWWRQREQGAAFQFGPPNYTPRERFVFTLTKNKIVNIQIFQFPRFLEIFE